MSTLLKTKLFTPPIRPELVSRPRLIERLDAGPRSGCKLTLVSAPAGFGKTTLLSEWVHQKSADAGKSNASPTSNTQYPNFAWLSLDEEDSEVARFWTYLIAALGTAHADLGQDALELLQAHQPPPAQAILTPLLNEIAALSQDTVLILDDYHLIPTPPFTRNWRSFWSTSRPTCTWSSPPARTRRCPPSACAPAAS
jgi:LuxR family maltose regulon positive regulatory protein